MADRIGIMGGTFDPIHNGHLLTAEYVRDACRLVKILFIPAANSPFKLEKKVAPAHDRLAMTRLAVADNPYFEASDIEMCRRGVSYTSDTIDELHRQFGRRATFFFITGADAINALPSWHASEHLLASCHFIAATRQGTKLDMAHLREAFGSLCERHIHQLTTPELEISSTEIRARIRAGRSVRYMLPAAVADYIKKEGLYR
ncbi:nicotinate-nucleotide adenylyltransferase [Mitsuokella jalaludinii]|uniref:nicotinate-nucleotide adenylyltransferase n=1 Tax=Mitsuokella jalaludinii TaxID=187979 RepID=UPI0029DF0CB3|nr:nicotinate-nucleotide adenylyltransferase [Selenomonadaceae bacterium]